MNKEIALIIRDQFVDSFNGVPVNPVLLSIFCRHINADGSRIIGYRGQDDLNRKVAEFLRHAADALEGKTNENN